MPKTQELKIKQKELEYHQVFKKEIYTLKNDLYYQFFENKNKRWFFDISYKPLHQPSGDSYSIRVVGEDQIFVFLVDAMGSGITASITSIMSSSFLNYLIDKYNDEQNFDFRACITEYYNYIKHLMFPDEVVSVSFVLFDFKQNHLQSAVFGMPPILIHYDNGTLKRFKANNFPLTGFSSQIKIDTINMQNIKKLLIYSDGLNESIVDKLQMYKDYMDDDFKNATNYKDFLKNALERVGTFGDDMTFFYIEKEVCSRCKIRNVSLKACSGCRIRNIDITSHMSKLDFAISEVENFLNTNGMEPHNKVYTLNAFTEVLINAYEHGNLKISSNEKSSHMHLGTFEDLLKQREALYGEKIINIYLHIKEQKGQKTFIIEVQDEGDGFNTDIMKNRLIKKEKFSGRGLLMISKMVDAFYYNKKGNKVVLKKFQKEK